MNDLSPRQEQILGVIVESVVERGHPPTLREIGDACGLVSSDLIYGYVRDLERMGRLTVTPEHPRAITITGAST